MTLSKIAVRRITKLADYMETLPPESKKHFDMGEVIDTADGLENLLLDYSTAGKTLPRSKLLSCGTTACALGWALTIPGFARAGLRFHPGSFYTAPAARFFHISEEQAEDLFSPSLISRIKTPKQWARHARNFLNQHAKSKAAKS